VLRSVRRNPREEFLRAPLLGGNSVTDIPAGEHSHRGDEATWAARTPTAERKNYADLSDGPPSMLEAFGFGPLELMAYFSYQRRCIHPECFCNFENTAQTRVYEATFKLTYIRDIAAQLMSECGLGETFSDATLGQDIADHSFKSVHFLSLRNTDWPCHIFSL
jgi:hypothetical protein